MHSDTGAGTLPAASREPARRSMPNANSRSIMSIAFLTTPAPLRNPGTTTPSFDFWQSLPLDIVYEILLYLNPTDLLRLSLVSHVFKGFMSSGRALMIWRTTRKTYKLPEPPKDFSEQSWAKLWLLPWCQICGKTEWHSIDWLILRRACPACRKKSTLQVWNNDIVNHVRKTTRSSYASLRHVDVDDLKMAWSEDYRAVVKILADLKCPGKDKELEKWKQENTHEAEVALDIAREYEKYYEETVKPIVRGEADRVLAVRIEKVKALLLDAGHEKVDVNRAISSKSPGISRGGERISDATWARIRVKLDRLVEVKRNQRIARESKMVVTRRLAAFRKIYHDLLETLPASKAYRYPSIELLRILPGIVDVVDRDRDLPVPVSELQTIVDNIESHALAHLENVADRLREQFRSRIKKDLPHHIDPLQLAMLVARCSVRKNKRWVSECYDQILLGWPMIVTHSCPRSAHRNHETRPGVQVPAPCPIVLSERDTTSAAGLVEMANLDPYTTTVDEMDVHNPRYVCEGWRCKGNSIEVHTWRSAINHIRERFLSSSGDHTMRLASPEEAKAAQDAYYTIGDSAKAWSCNICSIHLRPSSAVTKQEVLEHVSARHRVEYPVPNEDYFLNHRCRFAYETPYKLTPKTPSLNPFDSSFERDFGAWFCADFDSDLEG